MATALAAQIACTEAQRRQMNQRSFGSSGTAAAPQSREPAQPAADTAGNTREPRKVIRLQVNFDVLRARVARGVFSESAMISG